MIVKSKGFQLALAFFLGAVVLMLPRPQGDTFKISGDDGQKLLTQVKGNFILVSTDKDKSYVIRAKDPASKDATAKST